MVRDRSNIIPPSMKGRSAAAWTAALLLWQLHQAPVSVLAVALCFLTFTMSLLRRYSTPGFPMCHQHADVLTMKLPKLGPDGLGFRGAPRNAGSTLPKWVYFESGGLWACFFLLVF